MGKPQAANEGHQRGGGLECGATVRSLPCSERTQRGELTPSPQTSRASTQPLLHLPPPTAPLPHQTIRPCSRSRTQEAWIKRLRDDGSRSTSAQGAGAQPAARGVELSGYVRATSRALESGWSGAGLWGRVCGKDSHEARWANLRRTRPRRSATRAGPVRDRPPRTRACQCLPRPLLQPNNSPLSGNLDGTSRSRRCRACRLVDQPRPPLDPECDADRGV